jgi:hypothetical protein
MKARIPFWEKSRFPVNDNILGFRGGVQTKLKPAAARLLVTVSRRGPEVWFWEIWPDQ